MLQLTRILATSGVAIGLALFGCTKDSDSSSTTSPPVHAHGDDDHDHEHDGGDDDQTHSGDEDGDGEHAHDDEQALGSVTIGGVTFEVSISGSVATDAEIHVDMTQTAGPTPLAVRVWVGQESGAGAIRSKTDGHDDHFHGHAEVPSELPADAALWIEVELASGDRIVGSLPLP
jgi:hypothetical protein